MQLLIFCSCVLPVLSAVITGQQALANFIRTTWKDLNEAATLNCPQPCPGVITWEREGRKVAECGLKEGLEFSCEGYQNQSILNVPHVNYSTRGFYSTRCSGKEICFQNLQPNCHNSSADRTAGGFLNLDLLTFHPVKLMFTRTDGGKETSVQMCSVDGRSVQPNPGYENRLTLSKNSLVLRDLRSADSGVYSVLEVHKGEALISTVSVSVKDVQESETVEDEDQKGNDAGCWKRFWLGELVLGVILGVLIQSGVLYLINIRNKKVRRTQPVLSSNFPQLVV